MLDSLKKLGGCKPKPFEHRFERSYIPEPMSGCWIWLGSGKSKYGHGRIKDDQGAAMGAHRASWIINRGPIPDNMCVMHKCDVPACVNPDHLMLGTILDNIQDMISKGRQSRGDRHKKYLAHLDRKGVKNNNSKLTPELATSIRYDTRTQRAIAKDFGITQATVSQIKKGVTWNG